MSSVIIVYLLGRALGLQIMGYLQIFDLYQIIMKITVQRSTQEMMVLSYLHLRTLGDMIQTLTLMLIGSILGRVANYLPVVSITNKFLADFISFIIYCISATRLWLS